jgi:hypothetical protein
MGIGINSGPVVVGNLGSEARTKYGIVGSVVNVASRIESNTVGGQVLVGEATYMRVVDHVTAPSPITVMMKGLKSPLVCYPVSAVGAPYHVEFSPHVPDSLIEIRLPFEMWLLDGKKIVSGPITGETCGINEKIISITCNQDLAPLTNVKLLFTFCQQAHCFSDVYAKVTEVSKNSRPPVFSLHVTYMDQSDRELLSRWTQAA